MINDYCSQVKIWFQNRRTKWKKQDNISNAEAAEHKNHNSPKVTSQTSKKQRSGNAETDSVRSGFEGSSDSNNSLLVSDSCAIDSDSSAGRRSVPPMRSLHATSGGLAALNRNSLSSLPGSDSPLPTESAQYNSQNHDSVADSRFKEYEFKREPKISSRDLVAAKGESRIGANYHSSAKKVAEKTDDVKTESEDSAKSSADAETDKNSVDESDRKDGVSQKTPS